MLWHCQLPTLAVAWFGPPSLTSSGESWRLTVPSTAAAHDGCRTRRKPTFFMFTGLSVPVFMSLPYFVSQAAGETSFAIVMVVIVVMAMMAGSYCNV